jgi:predicted GNAT superfamily acetyltransferase
MTDDINAGDDSDRLFLYWDLAANRPSNVHSSDSVSVELPQDIAQLRKTDLPSAQNWRKQTRALIEPLLAKGWTISGMKNRTHLLIDPPN